MQKERAAQDESDLKEVAKELDLMKDSYDRKIRGVFYQLENPEFKQKSTVRGLVLNKPAKGSYEDWVELGTLPDPTISAIRDMLNTRQAGIGDIEWK